MTRRPRLFAPWVALATVCTALMWLYPGEETIPYHVAWIGVALAFGIEPWSVTRTYLAILGFSVISGAILVLRAATGYIGWGETAEIPLMSALLLVSMWHVRRRQSAMGELVELSRRERLQAEQRERLARVTSHVMRTPLTIAMGYVDLLLQRAADGQEQADLVVVREELGRLERASDRLVRMIKLQEPATSEVVDLDAFVREVAERWANVADRRWVVDAVAGIGTTASEPLRGSLDTLIENALRYTDVGDVVRVCALRTSGWIMVGVADSGPGLSTEVADAVNQHDFGDLAGVMDSRSQTGLGLSLVQEMVSPYAGRLVVGRSREGGALVLMALPQAQHGDAGASPVEALEATPAPAPTRGSRQVGSPR